MRENLFKKKKEVGNEKRGWSGVEADGDSSFRVKRSLWSFSSQGVDDFMYIF